MNDNIQDIHYCVNLSSEQCRYLISDKSSINRQKCLFQLMEKAVLTKTSYRIKGIEIELEVGQVAASDVEMAEYMECNRKTIGKFIDSLNRLGMVTTRSNNRTSIHTLHFLACWYVDGVMVINPHYTKLSANAEGHTGNGRTPYPKEGQSEKGQPITSPISLRDGREDHITVRKSTGEEEIP